MTMSIDGLSHSMVGDRNKRGGLAQPVSRRREECLNVVCFQNLFDARRKIAA
jgi:hypothetical protein